MATLPTFFVDDTAVTAREAEVTNADFDTGMNLGGACACGIGINMLQGAVVGEAQQFTLLDQFENARAAQISQSIGGYPYADPADWPSSGGTEGTAPDAVVRYGPPSADGDGSIVPTANATLNTLALGWVASV